MVLEHGQPGVDAHDPGYALDPAAAMSRGLIRMSGPPREMIFGRAFRPIGVFTVSTRWKTNRSTRRSNRSRDAMPSMRNGRWPGSRPDIHVGWSLADSRAISAPELPAPTTRTPPSRNWDGLSPLRVLSAAAPEAAGELARTVLGPVLDLPEHDRTVLLDTLQAWWFDAGGSATETGKAIYCHPNTVRYRLRRVQDYTGRSLDDPRAAAELLIALDSLRFG